jgi:hypothetical protein
MQTPLPRAEDAAVARVEPGGWSMPVFQRHLLMNPLKVSRVTMEFGQQASKKSLLWRMSSTALSSMRVRMTTDGRLLPPGSEANGRDEAPGLICLGERCWH